MTDRETGRLKKRRHQLLALAVAFYRRFPDKFCEDRLEIKLNLYQKVLIRAFFQHKYSMWLMSRGLGKTWLGALALCVYCILYKGTLAGVIAPSYRQSKITIEDKIVKELMDRSPLLRSEIKRVVLSQADARVEFFNGSRIMAVPTGDGNKIRGFRFHVIMADEYAQIKKEILDLCVNPMMNVKRNYQVGKMDYDDEIGNRLLITSSAYYRHNHFYNEFTGFVDFMARGNNQFFVTALPYQVGLDVGLFDGDHIEKEKRRLSKEEFDMEYGCVFPNTSDSTWVDPAHLEECSTLKNIETLGNKAFEYVMGLDCARADGGDNTVAKIVKLVPRRGRIERHDIYTLSLNGETFEKQAQEVRQLLQRFPSVIRIMMDTTGLGVGLADELAKHYTDPETGKVYPPLIDMNDAQAMRDIPDGVPLIYGVKANAENNHRMGMAVKTATQKKWVKMYSREAGDDKVERDITLTEDEERQILEAEATRREILSVEAKPQGLYFKFFTRGRGRKDRWTAMGLALWGVELIEADRNKPEDMLCVGACEVR